MKEVAQAPLDSEWALPITNGIGGELFVINLCASMTPIPALPKQLKGFEKYKLYQVSRQEDGRRRFRLRLGFFSSEADAEMVVSAVRSLYPTAFAGCMTNEDQRYMVDSTVVPSVRPAQSVKPQPAFALGLVDDQPPPVTNSHEASSMELTAKQPVLTTLLSLQSDSTPATSANTATPAPVAKPATIAKQTPQPIAKPIIAASIVSPVVTRKTSEMPLANRAPQIVDDYVPVLDTTLTIRTLTRTEAEDPNRPKWFVVQLALSEQPVNLDAMPKLDIFAAYSLYSVALMETGTIRHALRLGFFREEVSAEAVMGYLKTFFATPCISQISTSEYDRFVESRPIRVSPPQEKVVNLENKREAPSRLATTHATNPGTVNRPVAAPPKPATSKASTAQRTTPTRIQSDLKVSSAARPQSFLSRLIGRQLD